MRVLEFFQHRTTRWSRSTRDSAPAEPAARPAPKVQAPIDFNDLYTENHDFVWRSVQCLGIPDDAIDDAVQNVFVVAARKLDAFEHRSHPRTWLYAIARRVVKDMRRGRARYERRRAAFADQTQALDAQRPADAYARSDAARTLHHLLDNLDDAKREVFVLCELEGFTGPEVAEALDLSLPAIYARLRAARQELARAAAQLDSDPESPGEPGERRRSCRPSTS